MRLLILTMQHDFHAVAVAEVLRERGHDVVRLHHADFPTRQTIAFEYGARGTQASLRGVALEDCDPRRFDAVWYRRPMPPMMPQGLAREDVEFVRREIAAASFALADLLGRGGFWINPQAAARRAQSKPLQLDIAQRCLLEIPRTLISNEPSEIRAFVESLGANCVFKPLTYGDWHEDGAPHALYTARVTPAQLPADDVLRLCPGIFQQCIDKAFEVRVTFMGASCCAVRIDSQSTRRGTLDWRAAQDREPLRTTPIELPESVYWKCRRLMLEFGIVFGCFDFIVDVDGRWVFLEVNEAGQFLFLEEWCPEVPALDMFCRFVESRDPDFRYRANANSRASYQALCAAGQCDALLARDLELHADPMPLRKPPQAA